LRVAREPDHGLLWSSGPGSLLGQWATRKRERKLGHALLLAAGPRRKMGRGPKFTVTLRICLYIYIFQMHFMNILLRLNDYLYSNLFDNLFRGKKSTKRCF
jgi:hypothetical protein